MNEELFARFRKCAVEVLSVEESAVTLDAKFGDDLDADSLDLVELVMARRVAPLVGYHSILTLTPGLQPVPQASTRASKESDTGSSRRSVRLQTTSDAHTPKHIQLSNIHIVPNV